MKARFSTLLLCLSIYFIASADNGRMFQTYRIVNQEKGLSNNKITDIARDSLGTCWIGMQKGLNRISEGKITDYSSEHFLNQSITFVFSDDRNQIWAGCNSGLYLYDYNTDRFYPIIIDGEAVSRPRDYDLTDDGIVFNTKTGIIKYSYSDRQCKVLQRRTNYRKTYSTFKMADDTTAIVTINTDGVYKLNLKTNGLTLLYALEYNDYAKKSHIDQFGRLWLSVHNKGMYCISIKKGECLYRMNSRNTALKNDIILDIFESDGMIFLATDGGGATVLDPISLDVMPLDKYLGRYIPKQVQSVNDIYKDKDGIWLGTIRYGLIFIYDSPILSANYEYPYIKLGKETDDYVVQCISEDSDGNIWIGTDGHGLKRYIPGKPQETYNIPGTEELKITDIEPIGNNGILFTAYNDGMYRLTKSSGKIERVPICNKKTDLHIFSRDMIVNLFRFSEDEILICTDKLYIYRISDKSVSELPFSGAGDNHYIKGKPYNGKQSLLYNVSTIYLFEHSTGNVSEIFHGNTETIQSAIIVNDKILVVADYTLYILDTDAGKLDPIPFKYNGEILSILQDRDSNLWIATYDKIILAEKDNPDTYRIIDKSDGILPNDYFYPDINLISSDGILYFGGTSGLRMININALPEPDALDNISILSVKIDGIGSGYESGKDKTVIHVPGKYQSLEISLVIGGADVFKSHKFKYTVTGNRKVTDIYSDNTLSLSTLSPGTYSLGISVLDRSDKWIESDYPIIISVKKPWWSNIILLGGIFSAVILSAFSGMYFYFRREKKKSAKTYKERKKKLSDNKIRFLINISHELRTPLTLIYAPLKRMLEKDEIPAEIKESLKPIYHQSMQMTRIINMVIDARKFEEGYSRLIITSNDFNAWAKRVAEDFRIEYESKNMKLEYDFDENIGTLNFDEGKCMMCLSNLMMNAYKYSNAGSKVTVKTELRNKYVRLSVIDQGIGLKNIDINKLFDRFERGGSRANGFGLGLSYTKQLIEAHPGGHVGAVQNDTAGSTFFFELPTDIASADIPIEGDSLIFEARKSELPESDSFNTSKISILVADDDPDILKFIYESLEPEFRKVVTARDGNEAFEKALQHKPDLILSDVIMPGMNGFELCRKVKDTLDVSHIPVILLTAQADISHRTEGYKSWADLFLPKPFDIQELISAIKNVLYNRQRTKQRISTDFISTAAAEITFSSADEKFMRKLDEFIHMNIANEKLDAQCIIDHMCMGRAAFYKKMKEITDMGVKQYVSHIRMSIAAERLKTTDDPIAEIAVSVGFGDTQYFSRAFRQIYNDSPTGYRNSNRESNG